MDMESTRRSKEPGAKKPRLIDELNRGSNPTARPTFPQPQQPTLPSARFRTNGDRDSESSDSGRVGYYPQPLPPHQELVAQYKTALGELTINSKPIITNLTIIAGENLSAAKAVAGTICNNILEVPSEQKLPSLYLLDSVVKNIGRDYIKYFAARLPEVFCKAYQHVDPSLHSSMRHLFGTWKTVFPPQTLQMIEKELGFKPAINGSASASATLKLKSDSQSQRPASIHVNPKYLERQCLQQSSTAKGVVSDMTEAISNSNVDPERPTRVLGASRPWLDPRLNLHSNQRIQRDAFNDSVPDKSIDESFGGIENSSDISSKLTLSMGRTGSRVTELGHDKWNKAGIDVPEATLTGQRNGLNVKLGFSNHETPKSTNLDAHHHPTQNITNMSSVVSNSWKNSEEEEFMWDEMSSGMASDGVASVPNNLKDPWMGGDDENLEGEDHLQIIHPFGVKVDRKISTVTKQPVALGGDSSFSRKMQEHRSMEKLNMNSGYLEGSVSNLGDLSANTNSLVARMGHSHPMKNLAQADHLQAPKTSQFLRGLQSQYIKDLSAALTPNARVGDLHRSGEKDLQVPLSSVTSIQPMHQQQQLDSLKITVKTKKPPHSKVSLASETSEQLTTNSLSAAAVKSGILPKKSITCSFPSTSSLLTSHLPSKLGDQPTMSGGPSPATLISSESVAASPSLLVPLNSDSPVLPKVQRPLVSTTQFLSSSNVSSVSAPTSNATKINSSNPISNLLSSLVAKGLIYSETESSTKVLPEVLVGLEKQTKSISAGSSLPVALVSCSAAVPVPSSRDEATTSLPLCHSTSAEIRNIIGFDFKQDVIRELHPDVIKELSDDLPHHCRVCGIKLKQEEQLNRHLEWHSIIETEQNGLTGTSRKWYARSDDWIAGNARYPSELSDSVDVYGEETDRSQMGTMVLADENQCMCVLCGELFDDVYSEERDEWMFRGAVYLNNSDDNGEMKGTNLGPIIHAKCLSENSLSSPTKMEQD